MPALRHAAAARQGGLVQIQRASPCLATGCTRSTAAAPNQHGSCQAQLCSPDSHVLPPAAALKRQLVELQSEVADAHQRLHLTQARVEQNLRRISELKEESARLGDAVTRARAAEAPTAPADAAPAAPASGATAAPAAGSTVDAPSLPQRSRKLASTAHPAAPGHSVPARSACGGAGPAASLQSPDQQRRRGLHSSLEIEEGLKNHWFAVAFVSKLGKVSRAELSLLSLPCPLHGGWEPLRCGGVLGMARRAEKSDKPQFGVHRALPARAGVGLLGNTTRALSHAALPALCIWPPPAG